MNFKEAFEKEQERLKNGMADISVDDAIVKYAVIDAVKDKYEFPIQAADCFGDINGDIEDICRDVDNNLRLDVYIEKAEERLVDEYDAKEKPKTKKKDDIDR